MNILLKKTMTDDQKAMILDGKELSDRYADELRMIISHAKQRRPKLVVFLIGERPDSISYVKMKQRYAESVGIEFELVQFCEEETYESISDKLKTVSQQVNDGIILQLPLPSHLESHRDSLISLIPPNKDVDGLTSENLGGLFRNRQTNHHIPCTPEAVVSILKNIGVELQGTHVVLIGCGELVGRPLAMLLLRYNATVTCCHSYTKDIESLSRLGDVVVVAVGHPRLVKKNWIKPGAVVIDVGITAVMENGKRKLIGDVDFNEVSNVASAITPVPGGVGPMTVAMLMTAVIRNFISDES